MDESKSTKEKIAALVDQLGVNGQFSVVLAQDTLTVLAAIPDGEELDLLEKTCRDFREVWRKHPAAATFWRHIGILIERDRTRRALMENIEIGQCEAIGEL